MNHGLKFCDKEGYEIVSIQMVVVVEALERTIPHIIKECFDEEEVSIEDIFK